MSITDLPTFVRTGFDFSTPQLALMRRSIGRECTDAEFDEFIAVSRLSALDPLRRQIVPFIVNASDIQPRRMLPRTTIDGLRAIAARHGDCRPMETAPSITCDADRIDSNTNPFGIVRAEVRAWMLRDGVWHPVCGEAWWDEYAPVRPCKDGCEGSAAVLDPMWARMGRVMIAKCAEAQALRRGWPDVIAGLYTEEELHSANLRETLVSERIRVRDVERKNDGGQALWFCFGPSAALEAVPRREIADRLLEPYGRLQTADEFSRFEVQNRQSLRVFWDWEPCEALIVKELAEERATLVSRCAAETAVRPNVRLP
jgi:phage recombination protein Bet